MKFIINKSFYITFLFFIILSIRIIFEGINGLMFSISKIALKYTITIATGIFCDFYFAFSRHLLVKIKIEIKNKSYSSEWTRWLEYTIGMSGPSLVLVVIYILQSLVWSFGLFKASMLLFCLATGLSSGTIVYLLMKVLKKFNKNEIIKFCIFTFGNAFLAFLIFTIVYLFIPSPKIPLRDFFMERAGVVCVVTMYIMGIPLYFISRKIKSFH